MAATGLVLGLPALAAVGTAATRGEASWWWMPPLAVVVLVLVGVPLLMRRLTWWLSDTTLTLTAGRRVLRRVEFATIERVQMVRTHPWVDLALWAPIDGSAAVKASISAFQVKDLDVVVRRVQAELAQRPDLLRESDRDDWAFCLGVLGL